MDRSQYFVAADNFDSTALLSDWQWLLGEGAYRVHQATAMGDLFLSAEDGKIWFLHTTYGKLIPIADSAQALDKLWDDRLQRRYVLSAYMVRDLRNQGVVLGPGQCYSWKVPLFLGGDRSAQNIEITDLHVHVSILGQLHEQCHDLEAGTTINDLIILAPDQLPPSGDD